MTIKSNPCKLCSSTFHTAAFCHQKPKKEIKRTSIKRSSRLTKEDFSKESKRLNNKKKSKVESRKGVIKKLDNIYSWYIRIKYSTDGVVSCVTCPARSPWQEMQNGHFYTRVRYATRWDDDNCHVQCMRCNVFLKGNYINYTKYMIDRYGREFVDELEKKSLRSVKIPTVELKEKIEYYRGEVDRMLKI